MSDTPFGLSAILPSPLDWITYYLLCFGIGVGLGLVFIRLVQSKWAARIRFNRNVRYFLKLARARKPEGFYLITLDGEEIPAQLRFVGFFQDYADSGKVMLFARWVVLPPRPGLRFKGMGCHMLPGGASIGVERSAFPYLQGKGATIHEDGSVTYD